MTNLENLSRDIVKLEKRIDDKDKDVISLMIQKETILYKLDLIQKQLDTIETSVKKGVGWNSFFVDFLKVAAQVAALVAAGKFLL
ncbi:hypothetical protein [Priestia flexa]|uniref:hypothetical protein n=1 Tax=Priestia flexa TaxID=86664 RepID=UPI001B34313A|nr:hypothetical protein [Priestia flexa]